MGRTTLKMALCQRSEGVVGRRNCGADGFPCPKRREPKPVLDKSDLVSVLFSVRGKPISFAPATTVRGEEGEQ
jgi:hypothetical protein